MAAEIFEKLSNIFSSSMSVKAEEEDEEEEEVSLLYLTTKYSLHCHDLGLG